VAVFTFTGPEAIGGGLRELYTANAERVMPGGKFLRSRASVSIKDLASVEELQSSLAVILHGGENAGAVERKEAHLSNFTDVENQAHEAKAFRHNDLTVEGSLRGDDGLIGGSSYENISRGCHRTIITRLNLICQ